MASIIAVSAYKFSKGLAPKYMDDVFKSCAILGTQMNLSYVHLIGNMIMAKIVYHTGEQPFGIALK